MLGHSFRMSEKRIFCRKKWLINAKSRLGRHGRPIPHFTHLFFELQSVYNALHSIDIIWHVSFSAMCDNLMRLLGKWNISVLERVLYQASVVLGWDQSLILLTYFLSNSQCAEHCTLLTSFSAKCDNLMRLLGKNKVTILDLSFEVKYVGTNTSRFYSLIFWATASVQHIALYWHRSTRQLQCNVWQFNEAVGKINAKSIRQMSWVLQKKIGKRVSDRDNENINFDNFKEKIPTY
jgi:hypothetical protein